MSATEQQSNECQVVNGCGIWTVACICTAGAAIEFVRPVSCFRLPTYNSVCTKYDDVTT